MVSTVQHGHPLPHMCFDMALVSLGDYDHLTLIPSERYSLRFILYFIAFWKRYSELRSKRRQVGARVRPRAQASGAHQHTFCSHLKRVVKQKFKPKYA